MRYVELHCRSNFSFLRGASHPDELCSRAAELGYAALAVTDRNTLAGVVRMHVAAKEHNLRLVVGAEIVPVDAPPVLLFPTDRAAYGRLCRLITRGRRREPKGGCRITLDDVEEFAEGSIAVALCPSPSPEGRDTRVAPPFPLPPSYKGGENRAPLAQYHDLFGDRLYLAAEFHHDGDARQRTEQLVELSRRHHIPLVAANDVCYHMPERRYLQDVLTCIREHCTLASAGWRLAANAERHLRPLDEIQRLYASLPGAIERTCEIAARCRFSLDELHYEYPEELCPPGTTTMAFLRTLTWAGAKERFGDGLPGRTRNALEHELRLIEELRYEPYFLTVWDLVRFARSRGILCQGRGSAANSAVCYCLGITAVDPDRIDLLFERFISRERNEPPDIDVDFEHERREEVFQYIYGKYGRERAGITAEVITYRPRSAVRDVGKALGLSLDRVDVLAKKLEWWNREKLPEDRLREAGLDPNDRTVRHLVALVGQIVGFPRHLSQHVGGFVITRGALCELVPIENGAMPSRTFIEWDKDDIDALGILKVDCLALGMLTCLHKCFDLVNTSDGATERRSDEGEESDDGAAVCHCCVSSEDKNVASPPNTADTAVAHDRTPLRTPESAIRNRQPVRSALTLETVPPEDPAVYDMLCRADSVGVFQVESRAQMSMLPRLRPRCFYDLVIEVAIVRPGPIQGGMVHPYLRRRSGREPITYPNPAIQGVLCKTLGVPLFQEQAMRLAVVAAGFSPGEADQLRRAMGAWRRPGVIEKLREGLVKGMTANGLSRRFAEQTFEQICGFGEYGFPESHAASFALLVYASAWLKLHFPAAYAAALINSQPMGFYAPAQIVRDAQQRGVEVRGIDVNHSSYDCTLEYSDEVTERRSDARGRSGNGATLRLGMRLIKGLSPEGARGIQVARGNRPFRNIADVGRRARVGRGTLARLAGADAFRSMGLDRRRALWDVLALCEELPLLAGFDDDDVPPPLPEMAVGEQIAADYDSTGLSLTGHPIGLVREELGRLHVVSAERIRQSRHGTPARVAGLVLVRQRPGTAAGIVFATLEDETGIANLIIRPAVYERFRTVSHGFAWIAEGRVERAGDVVHVQVSRIEDLSARLAEIRVASRDFH